MVPGRSPFHWGAVLVGVSRLDAALKHPLQDLMAPPPEAGQGSGPFLPDRPLGTLGFSQGGVPWISPSSC
jgi:hypothetical protein